MSTYYYYYLAIKKEDKLYPLGPFSYQGEYIPALVTQNESMDGFFTLFWNMPKEKVSYELFKACGCDSMDDFVKRHEDMYYLPYKELPVGEYIRKEYCLIDDIKQYETPGYWFDGFYDTMSASEYVRRMENELKFGPPKETEDCAGTKYTPKSVSEYSFYMYEDTKCYEYFAHKIRSVYHLLDRYPQSKEEDIYVVLLIG